MVLFFLLGIGVGCIGTIMGVGGGVVLIPILLAMFPDQNPSEITAISLFCVALNSTVGSISYFLKKRIHLKTTLLFSLTTIPGAWIGVQLNSYINRGLYQLIFGCFLIVMGSYLFIKKPHKNIDGSIVNLESSTTRNMIGLIGSFGIGLLASILGLGGGIIHVPFLSEVMQFPAHVAVATSQSLLSVSSSLAALRHYLNGTLRFDQLYVLFIGLGIVIGAPLGAKIASHIKGKTIIRLLGVALIAVGLRLLYVTV